MSNKYKYISKNFEFRVGGGNMRGDNFRARQGEIIIKAVDKVQGKKLSHCILAEGEVTGHKHEIIEGKAVLYQNEDGVMYLSVKSEKASLVHPDHKTVELKQGNYQITIQREYEISDQRYRNGYRNVMD